MKKILVVEDEFIIAYRIKELLEKSGIGDCVITDTYENSMDQIKQDLPDMVLLDIRLFEDEDAGIRLARYIQEHYNIPFIFLSGYSDEMTLKNAKLYKPATFITKPVIEKQLLAAVAMALPEKNEVKTKAVFLKGKYFENITYEKLIRASFSGYDFVSREIRFEEVLVIQAFNQVRRNTVLFKFRQPKCFFVVGATIEKVKELLPPFFEQVHQSFIINTHYVSAKREGHYITVGNENVPVGSVFKK
jgi:DNA-binding LytR/AlgR family response regulator